MWHLFEALRVRGSEDAAADRERTEARGVLAEVERVQQLAHLL